MSQINLETTQLNTLELIGILDKWGDAVAGVKGRKRSLQGKLNLTKQLIQESHGLLPLTAIGQTGEVLKIPQERLQDYPLYPFTVLTWDTFGEHINDLFRAEEDDDDDEESEKWKLPYDLIAELFTTPLQTGGLISLARFYDVFFSVISSRFAHLTNIATEIESRFSDNPLVGQLAKVLVILEASFSFPYATEHDLLQLLCPSIDSEGFQEQLRAAIKTLQAADLIHEFPRPGVYGLRLDNKYLLQSEFEQPPFSQQEIDFHLHQALIKYFQKRSEKAYLTKPTSLDMSFRERLLESIWDPARRTIYIKASKVKNGLQIMHPNGEMESICDSQLEFQNVVKWVKSDDLASETKRLKAMSLRSEFHNCIFWLVLKHPDFYYLPVEILLGQQFCDKYSEDPQQVDEFQQKQTYLAEVKSELNYMISTGLYCGVKIHKGQLIDTLENE